MTKTGKGILFTVSQSIDGHISNNTNKILKKQKTADEKEKKHPVKQQQTKIKTTTHLFLFSPLVYFPLSGGGGGGSHPDGKQFSAINLRPDFVFHTRKLISAPELRLRKILVSEKLKGGISND